MKRFILSLTVAVGALAVPSSALANHGTTCGYTSTQTVHSDTVTGPAPVVVYAGSGMSGQADAAVGVCAFSPTPLPGGTGTFAGGTAEVGAGEGVVTPNPTGVYAVVDGDNANSDPTNQGDGYVGVSTFETSPPKGTTCTDPANGGGSGTNSGGCIGTKPPLPATGDVLVPSPLVCGNSSGNTWDSTTRDGCAVP